ncbi:PTS system mannose/fructose/sorbose family transporter subunit IID [Dongshaea marina]|uniref:PTS system mannose/fructose/sorbose family transporter subunit IID n=1 Tax=Dongshaea marina TaxID=2047966 RepID=UPI001F2A6665|nr:PTS system mannose/fructose/sorbose family transporter subunit IID [Dongshaea marina]
MASDVDVLLGEEKALRRMEQALETSQVEVDEYQDQEQAADLTRRDINIMALRTLLLQASFNYERMQAGAGCMD